jgi:hypothetical protein
MEPENTKEKEIEEDSDACMIDSMLSDNDSEGEEMEEVEETF